MTEPTPGTNPATSPEVTGTIDLNAARAARREQRRKDGKDAVPKILIGERSYDLPPEMPAETVHGFGAVIGGEVAALGPAIEALFAGQYDTIAADALADGEPLSFDDEIFLLEQAMEIYGMPLPESLASDDS